MIEVIGVLVAAGDGEHAGAQDVTMLCVTNSGLRGSAIRRASRSAIPRRRSAAAKSMTRPSEVIRPPSNAAVIFLRPTAGNRNGAVVSSHMAGVARHDRVKGSV